MKTALRVTGLLAVLAALAVSSQAGEKAKWIPISENVTSSVKPGWPGLTAGVTVDRASGDVFMVIPDQGIWKSSDHGQTFARADKGEVGGRCETGCALNTDPNGKRLACFMVYGSSAMSADTGKTWTAFKTSHLDFGAVDWEASGQAMLALRHESGGKLCYSQDAGQTWKDLEKDFRAVGLFDVKTLLGSKGDGILRSADGGATWTKVSDIKPTGPVMRTFKGVGYWTSESGVLVSKDKGATWSVLGSPVNASFGPYFGESEKHLVVVGKEGFHETNDGGTTWKVVAPLPPNFDTGPVGPNFAWDWKANIFYASSMGKPTYRFER